MSKRTSIRVGLFGIVLAMVSGGSALGYEVAPLASPSAVVAQTGMPSLSSTQNTLYLPGEIRPPALVSQATWKKYCNRPSAFAGTGMHVSDPAYVAPVPPKPSPADYRRTSRKSRVAGSSVQRPVPVSAPVMRYVPPKTPTQTKKPQEPRVSAAVQAMPQSVQQPATGAKTASPYTSPAPEVAAPRAETATQPSAGKVPPTPPATSAALYVPSPLAQKDTGTTPVPPPAAPSASAKSPERRNPRSIAPNLAPDI